jgi:ferredoxin
VRLHVDLNCCEGHTVCAMAAPTLITLRDEDGRAQAVDRPLEPSELEAAERAVRSCPEQALSLDSD